MLFVSGDKKMLFSPINVTTKLFTQPALFIVGSRADSKHHSQRLYNAIPGSDKAIVTIEGASHVDMCDREPCMSQAVDLLTDFFHRTLNADAR